jgi:hypothetical protein
MEHTAAPTAAIIRPGEETLSDRARAMLDELADGDPDRYPDVLRAFQELARPHPFRRQHGSLDVRLAGLPQLALERCAHLDPERVSGIHATVVLGSSHNFGSGGRIYTAYDDEQGAQAQLGVIYEATGKYLAETFTRPTTGRWVRVHPVGAHRNDPWAYVWVDELTHCTGIGISERGW